MTMLELFKERLPKEATLLSAKEKSSRYDLVLEIEGKTVKGFLPKTCAPDKIDYTIDFIVCTNMASAYFESGNLDKTKYWLDKQNELICLE